VDLLLSDDQRAIVASVAEVLDDLMPMEKVRQLLDSDAGPEGGPGPLEALWRSAGELGWFGLGLSEDHGGTGFDLIDEALLFVELGRRITPGPFLATVLASRVAVLGGAADAAAALLSGEARAGLATQPPSGPAVLYDAADATYPWSSGRKVLSSCRRRWRRGGASNPGWIRC